MSKLNLWVPAIVVMSIIFLISSTPGEVIQAAGLGYEPFHINGHFFLFLILTFTYYKGTKNIVYSVLLSTTYGVLDEIHQMFVPLRSASLFDIWTDFAGALVAGFILWKLLPKMPVRLKSWLQN